MTQFNQSESSALLATLLGNNVNTIRVHGTFGKFIVTEAHGDPEFLGNQHILDEFPFTGRSYRERYREALALATEAALKGIEDEDEDDLSEDYPGQRITGPDYDTRDREGDTDPPCPIDPRKLCICGHVRDRHINGGACMAFAASARECPCDGFKAPEEHTS